MLSLHTKGQQNQKLRGVPVRNPGAPGPELPPASYRGAAGAAPTRVIGATLAKVLVVGLAALLFGFAAVSAAGCQSSDGGFRLPTTRELYDGHTKATAAYRATTQAVAGVRAQVEALPDGEARATLLKQLAKLEDAEKKAKRAIELSELAIKSVEEGRADPNLVAAAAAALGPYAAVAVMLLPVAYALFQRIKAARYQRIGAQLVQSVEAAWPSRTDTEKATLKQVQDEDTRVFVDRVKGG